jgi:hypothetical protein
VEELGQSTRDALTVSVFHHPYTWLNPINAQQFKRAVEDIRT